MNKDDIPYQDDDETDLKACYWVNRIDADMMLDADWVELKAWILSDSKNKKSFERFAGSQLMFKDVLSTVYDAVGDIGSKSRTGFVFGGSKSNFPNFINAPIFAALGMVLVLSVGVFVTDVSGVNQVQSQDISIVHISEIGEHRNFELPDGSVADLNTNTKLAVEFDKDNRVVKLAHGEAVFDVVSDPARPFTVETLAGTVTAIGTVFSVRATDDIVEIIVEEGTVELSSSLIPLERTLNSEDLVKANLLKAGDYTKISTNAGIVNRVSDIKLVENKLLWRSGWVRFDAQSLEEVVLEFNRYSRKPIVILDPQIADMEIGGTFPINRSEAFLDALQQGFNVEVIHTTDGTIQLKSVN